MNDLRTQSGMPYNALFGRSRRRAPKARTTLDALLLFEWNAPDGQRLVFRDDATFYTGGVNIHYALEQNGTRLNINNATMYDRLAGTGTSIVGAWRNDAIGEEIDYRADGRYIGLWDNEPLIYFGIYRTPAANTLDSYEYRGTWATEIGQLTFDSIFGTALTYPYVVDDTRLTLTVEGQHYVYTKVGPGPFDRSVA